MIDWTGKEEWTPLQKLIDVVYLRIGFSKRDAARLAKAMKDFVADKVDPEEVSAYFDWYLSNPWRRQNRPLTITVFLSPEHGCLSWIPAYRKRLIFNLAGLQQLEGPYIARPDIRDFLAPLEHRPTETNWSFSSLQVPWQSEVWLYLWYVVAGREHPSAIEMAHQSYGISYIDTVLQDVQAGGRERVWRRINQILGQFSQSVYQWQMRTATPDASFVVDAVQIIAHKDFKILRPIDTTGVVKAKERIRGSDLI
jgi:hypothetical protein